ncbi:uncharacterized protein LOC113600834 [Acinonyx jubatus]|uniref:Uncharacterized protein LOC113600834 n=1 Tax=Acinonyx jubatus TaxID=32536 RepID=A0ABM3PN51_ACIJB|nr:uncharacterized protein LOC113600834 [Acinonyx jubatus]
MGINTNTAAPAGLPESGQGSLVGTPPPPQAAGGFGGRAACLPSTCFAGLPLRLQVREGSCRLEQAWGRRASGEILPARRAAAFSRSPPGHAGSAHSELLQGHRLAQAPGARRAWSSALRAGLRLRPLLAPLGRRPALATNFSQVSCAGAAAPLSARSPRSVRPPVRRAQGPSLPASPARAEQALGGGAGGGDLRKTRHHLYSQVRAGAAPASPTPVALWAPSWPRPPLRRSRGGTSPVHGFRLRRAESQERAADSAHCLVFGNPWCHPGYPGTGRGSGILCVEKGGAHEKKSLSNYGGRGDVP